MRVADSEGTPRLEERSVDVEAMAAPLQVAAAATGMEAAHLVDQLVSPTVPQRGDEVSLATVCQLHCTVLT